MPAEHSRRDFRNLTLPSGTVLAELYRCRTRDEPRWVNDLARATGIGASIVSAIVRRFEDDGYVISWLVTPDRGKPLRLVALTDLGVPAVGEAVRRFGVRLGDLEGLPVVERSGSAADVAQELGILLGWARDRSGLSCAEVAALVGHQQPWLSKRESGAVQQVDVQKLWGIMRALNAPDDAVVRVVELAESLNRLCAERPGR